MQWVKKQLPQVRFVRSRVLHLGVGLIVAVFGCARVVADVRFPAVFTPGAVLQRDARVPIWGWAEPGEKVTVSFAGQEKLAKAEVDGKWQIELDEMGAAQPRPLIVEGANRIVVEDVAVGDVWICAGQSNMGCPVTQSRDGDLEILTADCPDIRLLTVPTECSQSPVEDFDGKWARCTPRTVADSSAVGYGSFRSNSMCQLG